MPLLVGFSVCSVAPPQPEHPQPVVPPVPPAPERRFVTVKRTPAATRKSPKIAAHLLSLCARAPGKGVYPILMRYSVCGGHFLIGLSQVRIMRIIANPNALQLQPHTGRSILLKQRSLANVAPGYDH